MVKNEISLKEHRERPFQCFYSASTVGDDQYGVQRLSEEVSLDSM